MDSLSRRVPWALAIVGGLHGWFAGYRSPTWHRFSWQPEREALPWLLALVFSAVFFLGGWLYFRKPRHERGSMWWAGAWILLSCAALGFGPVERGSTGDEAGVLLVSSRYPAGPAGADTAR